MADDGTANKLKEPVFNHKSTALTRSELFTKFGIMLTTYMGSQYGTLGATLISKTPNYEKKFFGYKTLIEDAGYDIHNSSHQFKYQKLQWTILNILLKNFHETDTTLVDEWGREKIALSHAARFPNANSSTHWLPFGSILYDRLRITYTDEEGTDAVVKILNHEQQKLRFLKINQLQAFLNWRNKILDSWNQLENVVAKHEPSYLAALQLLEVVRRHPNERLKQFALTFNDNFKDKSFTMTTLMEHLTSNFKSRELANKSDKLLGPPSAPASVNVTHGLTSPTGKKKCKNFATCQGYPRYKKFEYCDPCFVTVKTGISKKAADNIVMKNKQKNKKRFAKKRAKSADETDAEASALDAEEEAEANMVEAAADEENHKRKAPASEKVKGAKKGKVQTPSSAPSVHAAAAALRAPLMLQFARRAEVFASAAPNSLEKEAEIEQVEAKKTPKDQAKSL